MFMVKGECANIVKLLKVKIWFTGKNFIIFPIIAALMFLSSLAMTIAGVIHSGGEGVNFYQVTDYSSTFVFGLIIAYIVMMFMYRYSNDKLSVFPQTNNARFITTQAVNYIIAVWVGLTILTMYLLYYGAIKILSIFYDSVRFAINFNVGFIVAGFITFILYSFIIVAVIDLIGVILRKWTYYAAAVFTALIALAVVNIMTVIEYAPKALAFLVKEPSFGLFAVKALALWLAIVAVSLAINHFTVYYKKQSKSNTKIVVVICVAIALVIALGIPLVLLNSINSGGAGFNVVETESVEERVHNFFDGAEEIRIDISHLARGSRINLEAGDGISVIATGGAFIYGQNSFTAYLSGTEALENIQNDTLVVSFRPPFHHVNNFELTKFANPRVSVNFDGNTLNIEYMIDDAHVVIIPIWGIAGQFEVFRDRGFVSGNPLGFSSGGNSNANIFLWVE